MHCNFSTKRFLVKIVNSNVMPTLRGFRWYPYFGAQEYIVSGILDKQMTPLKHFSENHVFFVSW